MAPTPRYVQRAYQSNALLRLMRAGLGVGIVPSSLRSPQPPGILFKPIDAAPVETARYIAWRRHNQNPALRELLGRVIHINALERAPASHSGWIWAGHSGSPRGICTGGPPQGAQC
ncbi:LysR substrate-binding domain-containing protein [Pseudomonas typographi]|uniref:LysR substrate-binding domain-containing protein n=1 Tax=Pseudomonas typographi TaxID=2715964 RepID=A0ABR7Z561_9PSED|nr:hypothetical protein [Pseudomonas typographi]MBD1586928.1 hypothetical protein [Pseudomonas typographi]MBD1600613.1 hypothetical protein [Pseudomonas typographi]